jgi:hypothetical protein
MNKRQLIEDIRKYNHTAQPGFLAQFDEDALRQYLQRLVEAHNKRVRFNALQPQGMDLRMVS